MIGEMKILVDLQEGEERDNLGNLLYLTVSSTMLGCSKKVFSGCWGGRCQYMFSDSQASRTMSEIYTSVRYNLSHLVYSVTAADNTLLQTTKL